MLYTERFFFKIFCKNCKNFIHGLYINKTVLVNIEKIEVSKEILDQDYILITTDNEDIDPIDLQHLTCPKCYIKIYKEQCNKLGISDNELDKI